jgi:hypothetical protein
MDAYLKVRTAFTPTEETLVKMDVKPEKVQTVAKLLSAGLTRKLLVEDQYGY